MIIGLGTDIVRVSRIENLQKKYGDKFLNRILTAEEQKKFHSLKLEEQKKYLAKRFAAKEAFVKALGLGFNDEISFSYYFSDFTRIKTPLFEDSFDSIIIFIV